MSRAMKIRLPAQTVEVDPDLWALAYSVDRAEVRDDVKAYFDGYFQQIIEGLDLQPKGSNP
ncbi:hypothetical protein [Roseobacter litoralis]|uniref:hypothetical protein n=1 Tax=Roseobacter litoralis TaxID=42443 RepID=UPI002494F2B3|nr:hypothetical protein [Roseobacter litoralis]